MSKPMFTKHHYEAIAKVFYDNYAGAKTNGEALVEHSLLCGKMGDMFRDDNPNFDGDKFYEACTHE